MIMYNTFYALITLILFNSCQYDQKTSREPEKIIVDTDMGSDCDDAGALALLHKYVDLDKAEIIGCIYSSGKVPFGAGIIEAINIYYGRPDLPIGAYQGQEVGDPKDKMNAEKLAKDTVAFKNTIIYNSDVEDQTRLNRKLLVNQEDNSVTYLTIGHTVGLYELLVSTPDEISPLSGFELVRKKIKRWVAFGGGTERFDSHNFTKDWNFYKNGTAIYTKYLVENFPKPAFFINQTNEILTGKSLKNTPPGNIVRTVYSEWLGRINKTLDDQRISGDLIAVYYAVEGTGDFMVNSGKGWLEFDLEKGCRWHPGESNLDQTFITLKEGTYESFADYLNEMIAKLPTVLQK